MKKYAIIVAGGTGQRMKSAVPKQFLLLQGKPILYHTLLQFKKAFADIELILVLPQDQFPTWHLLCQEHPEILQQCPHQLVKGGNTRFHSSQQGVQAILINHHALVAIHDGVRPLVSVTCIQQAFQHAQKHGNAVLAVSSKDSIRQWDPNENIYFPLDRTQIKLIQTPQIFEVSLLKKAFQQEYQDFFTDDASVVELLGTEIQLVEGNYSNIKITTPEDMLIAEALTQNA
ncbi:2-C-methyl-D-erythritol 4-phosphate cytidylyltransferase [Cytophagaceae bacterium 50C-KIRBA]|uniref:2-C-methyl-D-erythritol 4-phosphate cytidylyltransferase n=1 Tax=Aquirufa beregesia TaxID=2516556 RepID=A0ABX0EUN2_9BACT|nr:2-C-methyl-D-erythritol 4-phosphate cytidylyltransferase [Aquirufa beregesia]NGZ42992.1 2-C-methyl-D-erythritol 4-phosphate cytidylyltransferase [Aquirufa beregesia]